MEYIDDRDEGMCFSSEEKKELLHRMEYFERDLSKQATTTRVGLGVASSFVVLLLTISAWYLTSRDAQLTIMANNINKMSINMAELGITMRFYADAFGAHVSSPENHPNNTERVDRLREDLLRHESGVHSPR